MKQSFLRTLPMGVGFMESRSQRTPDVPDDGPDWEQQDADERVTTVAPWRMLTVPSPRWALAVALGSCRYDIEEPTEEHPYRLAWLRDPVSGSWAAVFPADRSEGSGEYLVRQSGIRRLWDEAETAYRWWQAHGEPFITNWDWTITPDQQSTTPSPPPDLGPLPTNTQPGE